MEYGIRGSEINYLKVGQESGAIDENRCFNMLKCLGSGGRNVEHRR